MAKKAKSVWNEAKSGLENVRAALPRLSARYLEAGAALTKGRPSDGDLHKFRLQTKRFRYTLELFRPFFGPGLDTRLETLRGIQQALGEINDCAATERLLAAMRRVPAEQRERVAKLVKTRIAEQRAQLEPQLSEVFGGESERYWAGYLARFAGRRRRDSPRR